MVSPELAAMDAKPVLPSPKLSPTLRTTGTRTPPSSQIQEPSSLFASAEKLDAVGFVQPSLVSSVLISILN